MTRPWSGVGVGVVLRVLRVVERCLVEVAGGEWSFTQAAAFIDAQQFAKGAKGYKQ